MASKAPKEDPVLQRLDTIIRLQARVAVSSFKEQRDKIIFLSSAGFQPKHIGEVLGISPNAASMVLKRARKVTPTKGGESDGVQA